MIKTSKKGTWYEIIVPEHWSSFSLDHLFRSVWKAPKKTIHSLRIGKNVLLNSAAPDWTRPLSPGDRLQINAFCPEEPSAIPAFHEIDVLYEDDHLLILNKPPGMATHPNEPGQTDTLANAAAFHVQSEGFLLNVRHIHRLDRDTSGAVLFAKTSFAGAILDKMLEERKVKRTYLALVDGLLKTRKGTINRPIGRDRHHPVRRRVSKTGQTAITHFEAAAWLKKEQQTLVRCSLETGRTHQIRVHLSDLGYPLAGDKLYGGSGIYSRQALHAVKLELIHPFTQELIVCHAPFMDQPPIFNGVDPYSF
ncbi:RluA family pseudouridine synthase [Bacillus sp. FJAT-27251]|uniref:RluA family pseudouridine synthase n=1 Tax=Bacillus sp. FJAT-27251 TaxID=1684142 RepID=UPI0006A77851|nr:RluA family pseudouridine synthase [Bacillus sp. FJAT-27251]